MEERSGRKEVRCQIDLGAGGELEVEFGDASLGLNAGGGIEAIDIWLQAAVAGAPLRIRVKRVESGFAISLDKGSREGPWWKEDEEPTLLVVGNDGILSVIAGAGPAPGIDPGGGDEPRRETVHLGSVQFG